MTYNFDPDRWYENERRALERRRLSEPLDPQQYQAALERLDRRLEEMLRRLDGTYRIPG